MKRKKTNTFVTFCRNASAGPTLSGKAVSFASTSAGLFFSVTRLLARAPSSDGSICPWIGRGSEQQATPPPQCVSGAENASKEKSLFTLINT